MKRATDFVMRMASTAALVLVTGCTKSGDSTPSAETPIGDVKLASAGMPAADLTYVSDQSQVKLVTAPTVSYEPLDTFRAANAGTDTESTGDEGAEGSGATPGKAGPVSRAKMALASMFGGLMGGGGMPGGPPPPVPGEDAGASEGPAVALVDMKDTLAELPKHPAEVTGEPVESAKTAAMTLAKENLAKRVFAVKISEDQTIGEAIGADADPKAMEFSAAVMVGAKWINPNKLEVEIMCKLSDIVAELEQKFSSLDLTVVKAMVQDKGLAAKGTGDLKHEKGEPRRAKPGEMSRQAAEEGGGGGI